jgi:hypothetical protein
MNSFRYGTHEQKMVPRKVVMIFERNQLPEGKKQ